MESRSQVELVDLVGTEVVKIKVLDTWPLFTSIFNRQEIEQEIIENYPNAYMQFRVWLTKIS